MTPLTINYSEVIACAYMHPFTGGRLSSNLRSTIRESVHLVTCDHFRSRDNDGGHTTRTAISENPMLHANVMAVCFIERELLSIEVIITLREFSTFCSCVLDLGPMTFIYELDPYPLKIYRICKK